MEKFCGVKIKETYLEPELQFSKAVKLGYDSYNQNENFYNYGCFLRLTSNESDLYEIDYDLEGNRSFLKFIEVQRKQEKNFLIIQTQHAMPYQPDVFSTLMKYKCFYIHFDIWVKTSKDLFDILKNAEEYIKNGYGIKENFPEYIEYIDKTYKSRTPNISDPEASSMKMAYEIAKILEPYASCR